MKLFINHKIWWLILLLATMAVSAITSQHTTFSGMVTSITGHLVFAFFAAAIPGFVYYLLGNPLDSEEMMSTISVGWLILAVANLSVMP